MLNLKHWDWGVSTLGCCALQACIHVQLAGPVCSGLVPKTHIGATSFQNSCLQSGAEMSAALARTTSATTRTMMAAATSAAR